MKKNEFFSIEIRDINLEYDKYYLSFKTKKKNQNINQSTIISSITKNTLIPRFFIDKITNPILYKIFNRDDEEISQEINDQNEITIYLKSFTTNKILSSFNIRYPFFAQYYDFLDKSLERLKILEFPCIILQSENGYYSLKKISSREKNQNNEFIDDEEEETITCFSNKPKDTKNEEEKLEKPVEDVPLIIERTKPIKKKNPIKINFDSVLNEKVLYESILSEYKSKQLILINKKNDLNLLLQRRKESLAENQKKLEVIKNIEKNKNKINNLAKLKESLNNIYEYISKIVEDKKKFLLNSSSNIKCYEKKEKKIKEKDIPYLQKINEGLILTNYSLYKYYLNEFCYYFFNKKINSYYSFPTFYNIDLTNYGYKNISNNFILIDLDFDKKSLEGFFNTHQKEISIMFGNIIYLLYYLSKKFDIILPFSFQYNGSHSRLIINLKEQNIMDLFLKENEKVVFSYGPKRDENDIRHKMEMLSRMINDIIQHFCFKIFGNIDFKLDNNHSKINNGGEENNLYLSFLKLNKLFKIVLDKV